MRIGSTSVHLFFMILVSYVILNDVRLSDLFLDSGHYFSIVSLLSSAYSYKHYHCISTSFSLRCSTLRILTSSHLFFTVCGKIKLLFHFARNSDAPKRLTSVIYVYSFITTLLLIFKRHSTLTTCPPGVVMLFKCLG